MSSTTPQFRGSFVHLAKAHAIPDTDMEPRYSITAVFPKDDKKAMDFIKHLRAQIIDAAIKKFGSKENIGKKFRNPIVDGDGEDRDEWKGCYVVNLYNTRQPQVVDRHQNEIVDERELYSGAWYIASYTVFAWAHKVGGKGATVSLSNVMKTKDDTPLDGRTSADDDFADVDLPEDDAFLGSGDAADEEDDDLFG